MCSRPSLLRSHSERAFQKSNTLAMDITSLTDALIANLLAMPKRVRNPRARQVPKAKHLEHNYEVEAVDGGHQFMLIARQSTKIEANFSSGLVWLPAPGQRVVLTRYNGFDHVHGNPLEGHEFEFKCHIHLATERYIKIGRKPEMFAEPTERYATLADALKCLVADCNISGLGSSEGSDDTRQMRLL